MENRSLIKKVLETDPAARYALNVIINYPGGDRFGDLYAEPYTDISFHNLKLINKYDDLEDKLYLFFISFDL